MARFNPEVRPTNDPSYLGLSKEPDKVRPNTGLGDLFSNLGGLVGDVTATVDQNIKGKLKRDVYEGVDKLRDGQGGSDALKALPDPLNLDKGGPASSATMSPGREGGGTGGATESQRGIVSTNPAVEELRARVSRLNQGFRQGTIQDAYYYTQLDALNRQVRAKYPGYREEVDAMIREVTGIVPANALRKELLTNIATYQSTVDSKVQQDTKYLQDNGARIIQRVGQANYQKMLENPTSVNMPALRAEVSVVEAQELTTKQNTQRMEELEKQGKLDSKSAVEMATGEIDTIINNAFVAGSSGSGLSKITSMMDQIAKSGKAPTPEQEAALTQALSSLETQHALSTDAYLNKPRIARDGKMLSIAQIVGREEANKLREQAQDKLKVIRQALLDKDTGTLGLVERNIRATENKNAMAILGNPTLGQLAAGKRMLGDPFVSGILADQELGTKVMKETRSLMVTQVLNNGFQGIDDQFSRMILMGKNDPKYKYNGDDVKTVINDVRRGVIDSTNTVEGRLIFANHLFGKDSTDFLDKRFIADNGTRQNVYKMLVTPEMTKSMVELSKTGAKGQEAFDNYTRWASINYGRQFKQDVDTIAKNSNESDTFTVRWDDKEKQFVPELTPQGIKRWQETTGTEKMRLTERGGTPNIRSIVGGSTWDAIIRMNGITKNYQSVAEANGQNVTDTVKQVFSASGYAMDGTKPPQGPGFFKQMIDSVFGSGTPGSDAEDRLNERATQRFKEQNQPIAGPQKRSEGLSLENEKTASYEGRAHPVLEAVASGESKGNYDVEYGGKNIKVTDQSIDDLLAYQNAQRKANGTPAWPVGKYQFVESTLRGLKKELGLKGDEKLTPELQEQMGMALMERRGYSKYKRGEMTFNQFASGMMDEWEALKNDPKTFTRFYNAVNKDIQTASAE